MKVNDRNWILYLGLSDAGQNFRLREEWFESGPVERDLGMLVGSRLNMTQQCTLADKRANHILVFTTQCSQLFKRGNYPTVFTIGVAPP